jgi:hypothetical protein
VGTQARLSLRSPASLIARPGRSCS